MTEFKNITASVAFALAVAWISGCGGCNPEPMPSDLSPTEGPETGGTTVRITGEKFDMKNIPFRILANNGRSCRTELCTASQTLSLFEVSHKHHL